MSSGSTRFSYVRIPSFEEELMNVVSDIRAGQTQTRQELAALTASVHALRAEVQNTVTGEFGAFQRLHSLVTSVGVDLVGELNDVRQLLKKDIENSGKKMKRAFRGFGSFLNGKMDALRQSLLAAVEPKEDSPIDISPSEPEEDEDDEDSDC